MKGNRLKSRDRYLEEAMLFCDTDLIKVIAGVRRCGKSSLLDLIGIAIESKGVAGRGTGIWRGRAPLLPRYRSTCSPEKFSPCVSSRACSMVKLPETIWGMYSVACSSAWLNRSWKLAVLTVFVKGLIHAAR